MHWTTLVDVDSLARHLGHSRLALVDCRFQLNDPGWGMGEYVAAHIPGAVYAHLDRDLSGTKTGANGRHPLPDAGQLALTLGRLGISRAHQVVVYDQDNGMFASRLWWLLRWLGHERVALLDGGLAAWVSHGHAVRGGEESVAPEMFTGTANATMVASLAEVTEIVARPRPAIRLVDARAPERFRGDSEPLDPRAGHIPGAVDHFFRQNVDATGRFLPPATLKAQFAAVLGDIPPRQVVAYCGSGVTACHNLLALEHAGLPGARLYAGSWSEWSADTTRPIETGEGR